MTILVGESRYLKNRSRTFGLGTLVLCAQMEHGEAVPRSGGTGLF